MGTKIAGKITSVSKSQELHSVELHSEIDEMEIEIPKEGLCLQKTDNKVFMNPD